MKLEELAASEEKLGEALTKIKKMESDLSSKNDLLIAQVCFIYLFVFNKTAARYDSDAHINSIVFFIGYPCFLSLIPNFFFFKTIFNLCMRPKFYKYFLCFGNSILSIRWYMLFISYTSMLDPTSDEGALHTKLIDGKSQV